MVNAPLMQKVLDHITAHPEEWNQDTWGTKDACGTSHCFAGHAVSITGHKFVWDMLEGGDNVAAMVDVGLISDVAREELGLNLFQSLSLFYYDNTLADLYYLANAFTGGAITIPEELEARVKDRVIEVERAYANAADVMDARQGSALLRARGL